INNTVKSGGNNIKSTFTSSFNSAKSTVSNAMSSIRSSISSGMNSAVSVTRSAMNSVVSAMNAAASGARSAGYNTGIGFANGLASTAGTIMAIANSIAANVAATIRSAMDIHSPSRVTRELGAYTGEGFALGMQDWMDDINVIGKEYANAVTDQRWETDSQLATSANISSAGVSSSLDNLSDEVRNQQLTSPTFEVHNELVGDEIYTTIKSKEARESNKDNYFNFAT
ncbi:phage tail protein, partial [Streptococcus agalactiae]|nr:phage tail protein [Streptococcus agalactiae]